MGPIVKILDFVCHMVSVMIAKPGCGNLEVVTDKTSINGHDYMFQ